MRLQLLTLSGLVVLSVSGCGGGSDNTVVSPPATPVAPTSTSCFNAALLTAGTTLDTITRGTYSGGGTAMFTSHTTVGGTTLFNGTQARQTAETLAFAPDATLIAAGQVASTANATHYYTADSSAASLRELGDTVVSAGTTVNVLNTPYVESRFTLASGASFTQTYTQTQTATVAGVPRTTTYAYVTNVQYNGIVAVTVPAGTFQACQFVQTGTVSTNGGAATSSGTSTNWIIAGNGVLVKTVAVVPGTGGTSSTSTVELMSGAINGVAIAP